MIPDSGTRKLFMLTFRGHSLKYPHKSVRFFRILHLKLKNSQ